MSDLSKALLDWYDVHHRVLPWRMSKDPYRIWVSEIMLQQTRVETVKPYFLRFMETFPNIKVLASAPEEAYLKLWEGLGYYSRVRNLAKGAKLIQERFLGTMPETKEELLQVPGIGEYTASAILAIAFGEKEVAVDGNLIRIYARLNKASVVPNDASSKKACEQYLLQHIDENRAGDFNQALMDLGELVCLPNGAPKCDQCPFASFCKAHIEGKETSYPLPKKKVEKKRERRAIFCLIYQNKVLLFKRPADGLLGGMHEYLNVKLEGKKKPEQILKNLEIPCKTPMDLGKKKHVFTHLIWDMEGYVGYLEEAPKDGVLASREEILDRYTLPSAFSNFTDILLRRYLN